MSQYESDEYREGYENYKKPGHSRYEDGYDYQRGWADHELDELRERRREEEAEEEYQERKLHARKLEDEMREQEEYERLQDEYYDEQLYNAEPFPDDPEVMEDNPC